MMQGTKAASWGWEHENSKSSANSSLSGVQPLGSTDDATGATAQTEAEAFSEIYERHLSSVYNYLRSRTGNEEDAADLTQQTFVQALYAFSRYTERGVPVEVWLFRIARNLAVAAHRRQSRWGWRQRTVDLHLLPEALQPVANGAEEPEAATLQKEARSQLRSLFQSLNPDKRELLVLRFVSRLTAREIALVVGKSEQAVQKQLTRTLRALKEKYDEYD